jgi:hypothetical protein
MRESIKMLAPIFVGFVLTHFLLIAYGIASHGSGLRPEVEQTIREIHDIAAQYGTFVVRVLFLMAYLKCGRLEEGFLRVRCEQCHAGKLVAFSCRRRGFCSSRGARR